MQNRMKLFSAVLLIIMILSMVTPAFATEIEPTTESTTAPTTEHVHTWKTSSATKGMHYMFCTTCNEIQSGPHTFNSEEICIICGRYFHTHKWQRIEANLQFHTVVCTDCGESKTVTHSMHEDVCTVCGYEVHTCIMQYVGGAVYDSKHQTKCMFCDSTSLEEHTYGSDDKCTVCGAERPCEHQWTCNGEQYSGQHVLTCACGQTKTESHRWTWNAAGNYAFCTVCWLKDSGHWHSYVHPDGTRCLECGYEKSPHIWQYGNSFDQYHHVIICVHCGITKSESHYIEPNGRCLVCGDYDKDVVEPAETEPTETEPVDTEPTETEPVDTEPAETEPVDTEPAETEPVDTEPVETEPTETYPAEVANGEANPAEAKPEASDAIDEEDGEVDSQSDGSTLAWVVAVVSIAAGLTTGLFLWKKRSS